MTFSGPLQSWMFKSSGNDNGMMIIRPRAFVLLGNIFLLARSSLVGFWVLLGLHDEVLTGQPYEHPVRVKFMAVILIAISFGLVTTLLPIWKKAGARWLAAACFVGLLSVLEVIESAMIYTQVGHYGLHEYSYYAYGPSAAILAVLNFLISRREARR
ncbi:hypothetical protein [Pseudoxanthomonas mexicana]